MAMDFKSATPAGNIKLAQTNIHEFINKFPIAEAIMGHGKRGALTFEGFRNFCLSKGVCSPQEFEKDGRTWFSLLNVGGGGYIGSFEAGGGDTITEESRQTARSMVPSALRTMSSKGTKPYAYRGGIPYYEDEIKWMQERADSVLGSRRVDNAGGMRVYSYKVPVMFLPQELVGTRILHLSDIHIRKSGNEPKIRFLGALDRLIRADFVLITGDIIERNLHEPGREALQFLAGLFKGSKRAFVHGGHDNCSKDVGELKRLADEGYYDMTDRHAKFTLNGKPLNLVGLDDCNFPAKPESARQMPLLLPEERGETNILITHNLDGVGWTVQRCFDLVLSGHTHGGEINLKFFDFEISGYQRLEAQGYYKNLNRQKEAWKLLSPRTFSGISSGVGRHVGSINAELPGATLIILVAAD